MNKAVSIIKLLLVENSVEEAERLASVLRNAGITVRATHIKNAAELEAQLQTQTLDMILVNIASTAPTLAETVQLAHRGGKDIAVVALLDKLSEDDITHALQAAANAEPALKDPQEAPIIVSTTWWAGPLSVRLPSISAVIRPAVP